MRKLFYFLIAMVSAVIANAQDPSTWTEGQDVTDQIMLGEHDGTWTGVPNEHNGPYWQGSVPTEFETHDGIGVMGFYFDGKSQGNLIDIYQVVKVPAGHYTIKVQALYREGTPYDTFNSFFAGFPKKNAHLYASALASNDPAAEVTRDFSKPIRSLASSEQTEALLTTDMITDGQTWMADASGTTKDEEGNDVTFYCPCSLWGASLYYAAGKYWNELDIILLEESYMRVGIRKTANIAQDWIPFTNWHVIYNGPADQEAQIEFARQDCYTAIEQLDELMNKVSDAGFAGLAGAIEDMKMGYDDSASNDDATLDELIALYNEINATIDSYNKSIQIVNSLKELLDMSADMIASTNFPGINEFQAIYDKAEADSKTSDVEAIGSDPAAYFQKVFDELSKGRADYLNTGAADETGAKDFTALIKHPWFVNPEFNPTKNDDGTWTLKEATWVDWGAVGGPGGYNDKKNGRTDIASEVVLSADADAKNQWFKYINYTAGWSGGLNLFYQGGLIGVSDGWNSISAGTMEIRQQLVGLPNGYYSIKALMRGDNPNGTWAGDYHNIFAENSSGETVRSMTGNTDSYYSPTYGWWEYNPNVWQEHKTSIIAVPDGKLLIGGQSGMVGHYTGFRLMYYGETPAFSEMVQEEIDNTNKMAEGLSFKGDIKYVQDCIAKIQLPIVSVAAYEEALAAIHDAQEYIKLAKQAMGKYNAIETYTDIMSKYDPETDQYLAVDPALTYALGIGENEGDTYELVDGANAAASKYAEYIALYTNAVNLNDAAVNAIIAEQIAELKAGYKEADVITEYINALALPYNSAVLNSLGGASASEANPVDVSTFMVNPSFEDGPTNGWSGASPTTNQYAVGNAELWNAAAFTLSQKIAYLPAGTYELRARALYRDATAVTQELLDQYNAAGNEDNWANHNVQLFAKTSDDNDQFVYVKAIHSLKSTVPSFTEGKFDLDENNSEYDEDGNLIFPVYKEDLVIDMEAPAYPFDTKIGEYWFPASMYGFYAACKNDPNAYTNAVRITINNGETLEVGLRKTAAISQDWVIFDDFQLLYLSGDVLTSIEKVNKVEDSNAPIYNVAGQRVSKSYKGIIIQNGVKKFNK